MIQVILGLAQILVLGRSDTHVFSNAAASLPPAGNSAEWEISQQIVLIHLSDLNKL